MLTLRFILFSLGIIFSCVVFVCLDCLYQFFNYRPEIGYGKDLLGFMPHWYGRLTGPFYQELIPGAYISKFGLIGEWYPGDTFLTCSPPNIK